MNDCDCGVYAADYDYTGGNDADDDCADGDDGDDDDG